jgi:16S rRNA (cytosine1402-N4)-methyltransferase
MGYHLPVLLNESIEGLALKSGGVYLDGTLGGGGHFAHIVAGLATGGVAIGLDRDPEALAHVRASLPTTMTTTLVLQQSRFSNFDAVLKHHGIAALDGALLDLGVSSHQIDAAQRGFSYQHEANLDMRMDSNQPLTAAQILSQSSEGELLKILAEYGEIQNPRRMAALLHANAQTLKTSEDVKECLRTEYGPNLKPKVLSKLFQALRIAVNQELDELSSFLSKIERALRPGGRLAIISYHSLEDRLVKNFMRDRERGCCCDARQPVCTCGQLPTFKRISRKAIQPAESEVEENRRARSARLRVAERL